MLELDGFVEHPASRVAVDDEPGRIPHVQREVQRELDQALGRSVPMAGVPRPEFYERAKRSYCVIATAETRGWGDFIFETGVVLARDEPAVG